MIQLEAFRSEPVADVLVWWKAEKRYTKKPTQSPLHPQLDSLGLVAAVTS
jgi:hypothetical protein